MSPQAVPALSQLEQNLKEALAREKKRGRMRLAYVILVRLTWVQRARYNCTTVIPEGEILIPDWVQDCPPKE